MELIQNGGFETGKLDEGWRQLPGSAVLDGGVTDKKSHSGTYSLLLGPYDFVEYSFQPKAWPWPYQYASKLSFFALKGSQAPGGLLSIRIEYSWGKMETLECDPIEEEWKGFEYSLDEKERILGVTFMSRSVSADGPAEFYVDDVSLQGSESSTEGYKLALWWVVTPIVILGWFLAIMPK